MLFRYLAVARRYPSAAWFTLLGKVAKLPGFRADIVRDAEWRDDEKARRKDGGEALGWAIMGKVLRLTFCGIPIARAAVREGGALTAQHFWFNRSTRSVESLFTLAEKRGEPIRLVPGSKIFEAGCGPALLLYFLSDKYGLEPHGADIYAPAIEVAEAANVDGKATFHVADLAGGDFLRNLPDRYFGTLLISSHIGHARHLPNFEEYLDELFRVSGCVLVIDRDEGGVLEALERRGVDILKNNGTVFGVRRVTAELL